MAAFLVDTNILVYATDPGDADKQGRAADCLRRLGASGSGALSAQVLGEYFVVATRRLRPPVDEAEAEGVLTNLVRAWPVYDVTSLAVLEAVRAVQRYQLAYWDALIWATAKLHGVPNVLTEDVPSSELVEGVRFLNPFEERFDVALLG